MPKKKAKPRSSRKRRSANAKKSAPRRAASVATAERAARSRTEFQAHKLDLSEDESAAPAPPPFIPWGYGTDRVRALSVDPERLYVYWEVTDKGCSRAAKALGEDAPNASLNLRIYDTTGRLFDGTNAHGYFDHRVEEGARQRFFDIGKPGSDAIVEIGMRSDGGSFARIARSPKVSFPRREPAPPREPEWLTVHSFPEPAAVKGPKRSPEPPLLVAPFPEREATLSTPTTSPSEEPKTFEIDRRRHVASGPREVIVRDLGRFEESRVLSRWVLYRSWTVEPGGPSEAVDPAGEILGGSSVLVGGSERRFLGASENVHRGASERAVSRGASGRR